MGASLDGRTRVSLARFVMCFLGACDVLCVMWCVHCVKGTRMDGRNSWVLQLLYAGVGAALWCSLFPMVVSCEGNERGRALSTGFYLLFIHVVAWCGDQDEGAVGWGSAHERVM